MALPQGMKLRRPEVGINTINNKAFYLSPSPALGNEIAGNFNFIFDT